MNTFRYYPKTSHVNILISSQIFKKLSKYLFSNLPFVNEQWRNICGQSEPPLWKLQKVFTISFQFTIQVASKALVLTEIPMAYIYHALDVWFILKSLYFQKWVIQKEDFLASQVVSIEFVFCHIHAHVQICLFRLYIRFLCIKAKVFDSFAQGKALSKVKKLWKNSLAAKRFGNKNGADPPDLIILIGEKHRSNRLAVNFFDESLTVIGLDQIFHGPLNKIFIEFFVLCLFGQFDHEFGHCRCVWFLCYLHHCWVLWNLFMTGSTKFILTEETILASLIIIKSRLFMKVYIQSEIKFI